MIAVFLLGVLIGFLLLSVTASSRGRGGGKRSLTPPPSPRSQPHPRRRPRRTDRMKIEPRPKLINVRPGRAGPIACRLLLGGIITTTDRDRADRSTFLWGTRRGGPNRPETYVLSVLSLANTALRRLDAPFRVCIRPGTRRLQYLYGDPT